MLKNELVRGQYNNADAAQLVELEIQALKKALTKFDKLEKVFRQFDGTTLLSTAIYNAMEDMGLSLIKTFNLMKVEMFINDRMTTSVDGLKSIYMDKTRITILRAEDNEIFKPNSNRLDSSKICAALESSRVEMEAKLKGLEEGRSKIDSWIKEQKALLERLAELRQEIPREFRDYYQSLNVYWEGK